MNRKIKDGIIVCSKMSGAVLSIATFSVLTSANIEANATIGKGLGTKFMAVVRRALRTTPRTTPSLVGSRNVTGTGGKTLIAQTHDSEDGKFKINSSTGIVSFTNLQGEKVKYKEESAGVKLLTDPRELVKEKYLDGSGKERVYFGIKKNRIFDDGHKVDYRVVKEKISSSTSESRGVVLAPKSIAAPLKKSKTGSPTGTIVSSKPKFMSTDQGPISEEKVKKSTLQSLKMLQRLKRFFGEKPTTIQKPSLSTIKEE